MPSNRVGSFRPITNEHFPGFYSKWTHWLTETSYVARWHTTSISRYPNFCFFIPRMNLSANSFSSVINLTVISCWFCSLISFAASSGAVYDVFCVFSARFRVAAGAFPWWAVSLRGPRGRSWKCRDALDPGRGTSKGSERAWCTALYTEPYLKN